MAELGVFQLFTQESGTPVVPVLHLAGHQVVHIQTLRQLLLGDRSQQQDRLHVERRQLVEGGLTFTPDDHKSSRISQATQHQVGVEGELPDMVELLGKVVVFGDGPRHKTRHTAEIHAGKLLLEHVGNGHLAGGVGKLEKLLPFLHEPVVELVQRNLVVDGVLHKVRPPMFNR